MAKNIGTFTAGRGRFENIYMQLKGIANSAVSGSTSLTRHPTASTSYQAIGRGTVKLMDWNSVVNAGMGGEIFQNALKETARVHGYRR